MRYGVSVVFFSQALVNPRTEQVAELRDVEVSVDRAPAADFEVIHAQLVLRSLEALLDRPSCEGHPQHPLQGDVPGLREAIGDEVLDLVGITHVASHDEGVPWAMKLALLGDVVRGMLDLPDDGPLLTVLEAELPPLLPFEDR